MKNKTPMRKCIGCGESKPKKELVRITFYEGNLEFDKTGKAKGRGVYLCPNDECLSQAEKKNAIRRSLKENIKEEDINKVFEEIKNS